MALSYNTGLRTVLANWQTQADKKKQERLDRRDNPATCSRSTDKIKPFNLYVHWDN